MEDALILELLTAQVQALYAQGYARAALAHYSAVTARSTWNGYFRPELAKRALYAALGDPTLKFIQDVDTLLAEPK